ncbi:MAG: cupin domain-containing protein [Chitinophagaceae bacterium]
MSKSKFNPNAATFEEGVERVNQALKIAGLTVKDKITTSQDAHAIELVNLLAVDTVPDGFKKWQLPFVFDKSQLFISVSNPDVSVPEHSHDEGAGIRFIMSGSIYYNGKELKSGDWMYIPKGARYSFKTGPFGASFCYCYQCCCAPAFLNKGDVVINPDPFK